MKHYDYLEPKNNHRKSILWLGFSMVFIALQGFYTIPLQLPLIIGGNLIILCISGVLIIDFKDIWKNKL